MKILQSYRYRLEKRYELISKMHNRRKRGNILSSDIMKPDRDKVSANRAELEAQIGMTTYLAKLHSNMSEIGSPNRDANFKLDCAKDEVFANVK
jgi:hypothetical protein